MRKLIVLFCFIFLVLPPANGEETADLIKQADFLYSSREVVENCEKSIELYEKVMETDPENYEVCWKIVRAYKWLGDKYPQQERIKALEAGERYAKKAIEINPDGVDGHFWYGVSMGRIGEEKGILNSLFLVGPIKDEMEKILKLDPEHDGAHYVLSALYRKAPGWPLSCGDMDKSLKHALQAFEYKPDRIINRTGLAEVYMNKGKNKEAREQLLIALELPFEEDRIPEGKDDKAKAEELLKKVNERLGIGD